MSGPITVNVSPVIVVVPETMGRDPMAPVSSAAPINCSGASTMSTGSAGGSVVIRPLRNSQPVPVPMRGISCTQRAMNQAGEGCGARSPA
jgi:hypothetical protein